MKKRIVEYKGKLIEVVEDKTNNSCDGCLFRIENCSDPQKELDISCTKDKIKFKILKITGVKLKIFKK